VNPTALLPVPRSAPDDLRQDRVGHLVQRVLGRVTSQQTRRAYGYALELFLTFCGREGNPTLSAELVASYRTSLIGEGKSSSRVGVHLSAIKAVRSGLIATLATVVSPLAHSATWKETQSSRCRYTVYNTVVLGRVHTNVIYLV
jgi:hypothetical protein